jgi:uncharacterized protein
MPGAIRVEVVYALPRMQTLLDLTLPEGTTAAEAVRLSGILARHPEIDLPNARLGIFGRHVKADTPLRDRDRVEIYRALITDPKAGRRQRAAEGKLVKKGGGAGEAGSA